jgi:beta-galactosidase
MNRSRLFLAAIFTFAIFSVRADTRESRLLDTGWHFQQGDPANAQGTDFNDADWTTVSVPHCWGWQQAQRGENYLRGPGWYRRELDLGKPVAGKRYFVRFEAAGSVADVYVNGRKLGEHRGAFGAFCYEITSSLSASGTNWLAVRVDNTAQPDIAPISGDFPVYGGLYRPVHLIVTGEENFALTDHASPGVAWLQTSVSETQAVLDVDVEISNGAKKQKNFTLVARVLDAAGKEVVRTAQPILLHSSFIEPFHAQVTMEQPHLWNGRKDPYLYRAIVELRSANDGDVVDAVEQPLGLRFYSVDPEKGFFLNGQPYHLHGVNRHQDRPDKGWAISEADMDEDVALLKEIGATVVRCCHYQHSDYFYSQCDKAGILVWAEIPQVNVIHDTLAFETTSAEQLRDLIRQNINHPAIFAWSLFNEVGNGGTEDPYRELRDLKIIANGEDPTRPTIGATCVAQLPAMNKIPDLLGWNIYPGWYSEWGPLTDFAALEKYHFTSRHGGFCISEYGAGANVTQHEDNPKQPKAGGQWHPEEWQAIVHEAAWKQFKAHPYVWGTFVWNLADFTSYWRHEGGVAGRNDKGLVTYDRKIKKDAFYFYKANWSDEPMVYITDRRFTERTNAVTNVKIYSNAAQVELFVNGVSLNTRTNDGNGIFIWPEVKLAAGENKVEARAERDGQSLRDDCVWTLKQLQ